MPVAARFTGPAEVRGPAPRRAAAAVLAFGGIVSVLLAALACGCARVGPPGGGPDDSTPPAVVSTVPADGETSVDREAAVRLEFSEEMNRVSVERAFTMEPQAALKNLRWDGRALVAQPEDALSDSTTYTVVIAGSAQDYHGVSIAGSFGFSFSTGPRLDTGRIDGLVTMNREPVASASVWACTGPVEPDSLGIIDKCGYGATATPGGSFVIAGVRAQSAPYVVIAFLDRDEDGRYNTAEEPGRVSDAAALIDEPGESAGGLAIEIEDPIGEPTDVGEE